MMIRQWTYEAADGKVTLVIEAHPSEFSRGYRPRAGDKVRLVPDLAPPPSLWRRFVNWLEQ